MARPISSRTSCSSGTLSPGWYELFFLDLVDLNSSCSVVVSVPGFADETLLASVSSANKRDLICNSWKAIYCFVSAFVSSPKRPLKSSQMLLQPGSRFAAAMSNEEVLSYPPDVMFGIEEDVDCDALEN